MSISADTRFEFHNVGQGLFYSGEINFESNKIKKRFLFVYDCGSEKKAKIDYEITRFKNSIEEKRVIDLFVLSHFHADHVNGLDNLFNNFTVKRVIIPYFNLTERLIVSLQSINQEAWYYSFLSNPFKFFIERGVEEIIVINRGGGFDENNLNDDNLPGSPDSFENLELLINLEKGDINNFYEDENIDERIRDKIKIYTHKGYITILKLWLFKFFNYEVPIKTLNDFETCVKNIFQNQNIKDINIKDIILNKQLRNKIKKCYDKLKKDGNLKNFNNTSLVMMHTPINHKAMRVFRVLNNNFFPFICFYDCNFDCFEEFIRCLRHYCHHCHPRFYHNFIDKYHFYKCFAQSLTGDIDLNFNYRQFSTHFDFFKNKLLINQIPHHGAFKNWNNDFLYDFTPFFNIASAGETNRYGHPSIKVFDNILENCSFPFQVDENHWFTVKARFSW